MLRTLLALVLCLALLSPAAAADLGAQSPAKPAIEYPANTPDPARQGGDTFADAVPLALPVIDMSGVTTGYVDDYEEQCPYGGSTSPDVVYTITPGADVVVDIDMLGSLYDTCIYVYDVDFNVVGCNDDFHPDYTSKIEELTLYADMLYYLVIDGYGGDHGQYLLNISEFEPCDLVPPLDAILEGEPPLSYGYIDEYNGGCNSPDHGTPFQHVGWTCWFWGVSGWYIDLGGEMRDTDWFEFTVGDAGSITIDGDAEHPTYMFELGPQDCGTVAVIQTVIVGPCAEDQMVIYGAPGTTVWFWVGPTTYSGPVNEYHYSLYFDFGPCLATEAHSLSSVKSLFR